MICCQHILKIADKYDTKVGDVKKLIPNFSNKTTYVLYYRNLQLYLSLRLKLTKIHRALQFKQSDWMKKYIGFNTEKRKKMLPMTLKRIFLINDQFCLWKNDRESKKKNKRKIIK